MVLAGCAVLALLVAWYAGSATPSPAPQPPAGSVRLGPGPGEPVDGYLAGLAAQLPPPGTSALAFVQFAAERTPAAAATATSGTLLVSAVFRVPIPRVQTALRFEPLAPGSSPDVALSNARQRAQQAAAADAGRLTGRPRGGGRGRGGGAGRQHRCGRAGRAGQRRPGRVGGARPARPGVRAVQAAPPDAVARELALSPLLPEQTRSADPPPDDGTGSPGVRTSTHPDR